jgi:hypothetical protein
MSPYPPTASKVGRLVMMLIAPPLALRPYSVPWGAFQHFNARHVKEVTFQRLRSGNVHTVDIGGHGGIVDRCGPKISDAADIDLNRPRSQSNLQAGHGGGEVGYEREVLP